MSDNILIRADGSRQTGFGHLSRMAELARALAGKGVKTHFITCGADGAVRGFLAERGIPFTETPIASGEEGARFHRAAMAREGARLTILDSYAVDDRFRFTLKEEGAVIAAVDDIYQHWSHADVVINHNPSADASRYGDLKGILLAGPRYALINPAFAAARPAVSQPPTVLVSLGGTDALGQTERVVRLLDRVEEEFSIVVVGGKYDSAPGFPGTAHPCEWVPFTDDMPGIFARCSVAVTGGGITCMELACAGLPMLIVLTDRHQRENATAYTKAGVAEFGGALWELSEEELLGSFRKFFADRAPWEAKALNGRKMVDGQGADRVAEALATKA